jgi:hypothetical protein
VLQPTEAYVILSTLLLLPGMVVLAYLGLSGAFDRIEDVKYVAVAGDDAADEPGGSTAAKPAPVPRIEGRCGA